MSRSLPDGARAPDQLSDLSRLATAVAALAHEATAQRLLEETCRQLAGMVSATACTVSRLDGDLLRETAGYWPNRRGRGGPFSDHSYLVDDYPLTRAVLETGEARAVSLADDVVEPNEAFVLREIGMQALLMLPLSIGTRAWGLVELYDRRPRRFGAADITLARLMTSQAAGLLAQFEHAEHVQRLYRETLASLANALEAKDAYTSRHTEEVVALAVEVGRRVGLEGDDVNAVELGALLHDIGKIRIPESILLKPGKLDDEEWQIMRRHPEVGEQILQPIASLGDVLPIVRSSHERWDGRGYPDGLAGEDIPLGARIVSVCDAFRAMIEERPYRQPLSREEAIEELEAHAGTQFDPACVTALLAALEEREHEQPLLLHRPAHSAS
jgi:putative nucleotidyltransferase with HDIG domain